MRYTNNNNRSPGGHNSFFESRNENRRRRRRRRRKKKPHDAIEGLYETFWIHDLGKGKEAIAVVANKGCCCCYIFS
jgi:hypothetical protein